MSEPWGGCNPVTKTRKGVTNPKEEKDKYHVKGPVQNCYL